MTGGVGVEEMVRPRHVLIHRALDHAHPENAGVEVVVLPGSARVGERVRAECRCTGLGTGRVEGLRVPAPGLGEGAAPDARPAYEFIRPQSIFQRFSLGSVPLKPLASRRIHLFLSAMVATFDAMCVASCQWWPIVASGNSKAEARCGKATGPSAGSPTGA